MTSLPGAPLVAASMRGGAPSATGPSTLPRTPLDAALGSPGGHPTAPSSGAGSTSAEGPGASVGGAHEGTGGVESALAQSQEFNLYYLQLQEQMSAENRAYSAMSNVLKSRHDTVKNAIGNIR